MIYDLPTDLDLVRHHARYIEQEAQRIEEQALTSGAIRGEFQIVHVFRRPGPFGTELR